MYVSPNSIEEAIVELAEASAAPDPDIAALDFTAERRQLGAFIRATIARPRGFDEGTEAFWNAGEGELLGEGTASCGIEITEDRHSIQEQGRACGLQVDREVVSSVEGN